MIEYYLHTGLAATGELYRNFGNVNNGIGSIPNENILSTEITINGQTLLETVAEISVVGQIEIITNSGEFFLSGFQLRNETGFTDFANYEDPNLRFNIVTSGERSFYQDSSFTGLMTGFSGQAGNIQSNERVYLNGAKLTSGENYQINSNGNFEWIDDTETLTGTLFLMPEVNQFYLSGNHDVINNFFNKGTSIGFLNGVKVDASDFLETASLIEPLVNTGLNDQVEFNSDRNLSRILL